MFREGSGAVWRVLSGGTRGAAGISIISRKRGVVLGGLWGGGEWVRGALSGDHRVVSLGNAVVCEFSGDAVVESWCSSVHVDVLPADVAVCGVLSGGSSVVWGQLCNNGGGRPLQFRLSGSQRSSGLKPEKTGYYTRKTPRPPNHNRTVSGSK